MTSSIIISTEAGCEQWKDEWTQAVEAACCSIIQDMREKEREKGRERLIDREKKV